jgi:hypothetical protein
MVLVLLSRMSFMQNAVMLNAANKPFMLSVIMLNIGKLSVIMLNVVASNIQLSVIIKTILMNVVIFVRHICVFSRSKSSRTSTLKQSKHA